MPAARRRSVEGDDFGLRYGAGQRVPRRQVAGLSKTQNCVDSPDNRASGVERRGGSGGASAAGAGGKGDRVMSDAEKMTFE